MSVNVWHLEYIFFFLSLCSFVSDVVKIYYVSDEAVQQDVEIQEFVKDVACFGMNNSDSEYRFNNDIFRFKMSMYGCLCMVVCNLIYSICIVVCIKSPLNVYTS